MKTAIIGGLAGIAFYVVAICGVTFALSVLDQVPPPPTSDKEIGQ